MKNDLVTLRVELLELVRNADKKSLQKMYDLLKKEIKSGAFVWPEALKKELVSRAEEMDSSKTYRVPHPKVKAKALRLLKKKK